MGWKRYFFFLFQIIPTNVDFWRNLTATWTIGIFAVFYLLAPYLKRIITDYKTSLVFTFLVFLLSKYFPFFIKDGYFNFLNYLYPFFFGITAYLMSKENKENYLIIICVFLAFFSETVIFLYTCLFTILLLVTLKIDIKNKYIQNVVNTLDKYSYAVYLIHAFIIDTLYHYEFSLLVNAVIIILGTILFSFVGTRFISEPLYNYGRKKCNKL